MALLAGARPRVRDVAAAGVFEWSFYWHRRRLRAATGLGVLPVVLALLVALLKVADFQWLQPVLTRGTDIVPWFFVLWYLRALVMVVPLLLGTGLVSREVEANTLSYLLVRPLSRGSLLLGKFAGSWLVMCALLCGSFVLCTLVLLGADRFADAGAPLSRLPAYLLALCVGALAYGALFTFVGLVSPRPALVGLFLAFGWESAIPFLPGLIRKLTIRHHLVALIPHTGLPQPLVGTLAVPGVGEALLWLGSGVLLALVASVGVFARRDFA
jgi:ABC-2 type transport system permease protein